MRSETRTTPARHRDGKGAAVVLDGAAGRGGQVELRERQKIEGEAQFHLAPVIGVVADARDGGVEEDHPRRIYRQQRTPFAQMSLLLSLATSQLVGGADTDALTCALAVVGVAGLTASLGPAWRAVRVDPLEALREP